MNEMEWHIKNQEKNLLYSKKGTSEQNAFFG
jgi:hypothetical protein